jgi:hypothetical protein
MEIKYTETGICGLSCGLCPMFETQSASKCDGCKSPGRMTAGCPFITCAIKKMGVEFCWECEKSATCERWEKHRKAGKEHDSFKSYQKLEHDIRFVQTDGIEAFIQQQTIRESLLVRLLNEFNDGRSKSYYCIAATVMDIEELKSALNEATLKSKSFSSQDRSRLMHSILDNIALKKGYHLKLRK